MFSFYDFTVCIWCPEHSYDLILILTAKELAYQIVTFNIASYLRLLKGDKELAEIFYSLGTNYAFLTNVLRKSIYEYYVGRRYLLKNQKQVSNKFEQKLIFCN